MIALMNKCTRVNSQVWSVVAVIVVALPDDPMMRQG